MKPNQTAKPVYIEEVLDADFAEGAHPNCEISIDKFPMTSMVEGSCIVKEVTKHLGNHMLEAQDLEENIGVVRSEPSNRCVSCQKVLFNKDSKRHYTRVTEVQQSSYDSDHNRINLSATEAHHSSPEMSSLSTPQSSSSGRLHEGAKGIIAPNLLPSQTPDRSTRRRSDGAQLPVPRIVISQEARNIRTPTLGDRETHGTRNSDLGQPNLSEETDKWSSETELDFSNKRHQRSTTPLRLATTLEGGYRNRISNPYLDHRRRTRPICPGWRRRPIVIYASYNARRRPIIIYASYNRRRHPVIHSSGRGNGAGCCVPGRERTVSNSDPETGPRSQGEREDQSMYLDISRQREVITDSEFSIPVARF